MYSDDHVSKLCDIAPLAIIALCENNPSNKEELLENIGEKMISATEKMMDLAYSVDLSSHRSFVHRINKIIKKAEGKCLSDNYTKDIPYLPTRLPSKVNQHNKPMIDHFILTSEVFKDRYEWMCNCDNNMIKLPKESWGFDTYNFDFIQNQIELWYFLKVDFTNQDECDAVLRYKISRHTKEDIPLINAYKSRNNKKDDP